LACSAPPREADFDFPLILMARIRRDESCRCLPSYVPICLS